MLEPFDQPLASGFGDSAGFMDRMGSEQNSAFDSFYKFLDNSGRLLTMMRYLQPRELERRGLDKFDPWTGTYGVVNESLEPTPSGGYAVTARFSRFKNLPELKALWQNVADIRVARGVPEMQRARPHMVDEEGQLSDRIYVMAPMHPALEGYMEEIRERASEIKAGKVDPKDDNMLKLSNDAGEAALDVRMQDPNAPYNPEGKLAMVADNVGLPWNAAVKAGRSKHYSMGVTTVLVDNHPDCDTWLHRPLGDSLVHPPIGDYLYANGLSGLHHGKGNRRRTTKGDVQETARRESEDAGVSMRTYRPTEFSVLLRKIREDARKSRYSLAQFSGVDEAYILRLESGERQNPSRDVVVKLGLALVANSQSVTLHDVNGLLLAANFAPLLSRGETISWN